MSFHAGLDPNLKMFVHRKIINSFAEEDSAEVRHERLEQDQVFDNLLLKEKSEKTCGNVHDQESKLIPPIIMIQNEEDEEDDIHNIEIAQIESVYQRNSTPEGNVKYKNYKVLSPCNIPIRMYTPTGDRKMEKMIPKFELFDDFNSQRERLLTLIKESTPFSDVLRAIIKPIDLKHKTIEAIRQSNVSSMDDYINFIKTANFPPSPSLSIFSDERLNTPPSSPESEIGIKKLIKSKSIDEENLSRKIFKRQASVPTDTINMSLSDELRQADRHNQRSLTPKSMSNFEYNYFHRPASSLSIYSECRKTPIESKKAILRSFVQRNMILQSSNRDRLAKMALAIEEDCENDENYAYASSARLMEKRVETMLDEIKDLKESLIEIHEDFQMNDRRVLYLLSEAKSLSMELEVLHYLDDIITLMNGSLQVKGFRNKWPFIFPEDERLNRNLII